MKKHYNSVLLIVILIGLCCSLFLNWQRYQIERVNTTVETVMDYRAIARMAHMEGLTEEDTLKLFKDRGVTTLALFDTTLQSLADKGAITIATGSELLHAKNLGSLDSAWENVVNNPNFNTEAVYVAKGTSDNALKDVEADALVRFGEAKVKVMSESPKILQILGDTILIKDYSRPDEQKGVREIELGLSTDELLLANKLGFMVMARPNNYTYPCCDTAKDSKAQVDSFFNRLDNSKAKISLFAAAGKTSLGFDHNLDYVASELSKRHITLAMVEGVTQLQFIPMKGLTEMADMMKYQVARVYTIDKDEQKKLLVSEALRRWDLSDAERNLRVNYIKTFLTPRDGKSVLNTNLDYVSDIEKNVQARGFTSGKASILEAYVPKTGFMIPLAFAMVAAWIIYLSLLVRLEDKTQYILCLVLGGALTVLLFTSQALTARHIIALGAATMFPVLSMNYIMRLWEQKTDVQQTILGILISATTKLALAVILSLVGASIVGAILGDIRFFLEIDIYKGVKLTFVLPIILMGILFFKSHAIWQGDKLDNSLTARLKELLTMPFTFKTLVALGVLGIIAWIFVGRSGHTAGVPVPALEIKLRIFLEQLMYARPREKEFLIGHPAFYLATYAAAKKCPNLLYMAFVLAATIGQGSLVQTFAHMRTPIIMSYIRAFDGYALGAALGCIALLIFAGLYPYIQRRMQKQ